MTEMPQSLRLIGYEVLGTHGFALPLFGTDVGANSLYLAYATVPGDSRARIAGFEPYTPWSEVRLPREETRPAEVNGLWLDVFVWGVEVHVGESVELWRKLSPRQAIMAGTAPLALLALADRANAANATLRVTALAWWEQSAGAAKAKTWELDSYLRGLALRTLRRALGAEARSTPMLQALMEVEVVEEEEDSATGLSLLLPDELKGFAWDGDAADYTDLREAVEAFSLQWRGVRTKWRTFSFRHAIALAPPLPGPLDLIHVTTAAQAIAAISSGALHALHSQEFERDLVHFTLAHTVYSSRPEESATGNLSLAPVVFVVMPDYLPEPHQAYPFDPKRVFTSGIQGGIALEEYVLGNSLDAVRRYLSWAFGSFRNYLEGRLRDGLERELPASSLQARNYLRIVRSGIERKSAFADDRISPIEISYSADIPLKGHCRLIVLPEPMLADADLMDQLEQLGIRAVAYSLFSLDRNSLTAQVTSIVRKNLRQVADPSE